VGPANVITWLKLCVCSACVAVLLSVWLTVPMPDTITFGTWRGLGTAGAAVVGALVTLWAGSWARSTFAILVGLIAGAVWLDFAMPDDVVHARPTLLGVINLVRSLRGDLAMLLAGGCCGAFAASRILGRLKPRRGARGAP
jgi:hypothetical protein